MALKESEERGFRLTRLWEYNATETRLRRDWLDYGSTMQLRTDWLDDELN